MQRALSYTVAVIILIIVAIGIAVLTFAWYSSIQQKSQERLGEPAGGTTLLSSTTLKLMKTEAASGGRPKEGEGLKITVRNIGGVTLDMSNLKVYINGEESNVSAGWYQQHTSTTTGCLCVGNGDFCTAIEDSSTVNLDWNGTPYSASLYLYQSNVDYAHSIYVNGVKIANSNVTPGGSKCSPTHEVVYSFDPSILNKGSNEIKITNDANHGDDWTATNNKIVVWVTTSNALLAPGETTSFVATSPLKNGYNEIILEIEGFMLKWSEIV